MVPSLAQMESTSGTTLPLIRLLVYRFSVLWSQIYPTKLSPTVPDPVLTRGQEVVQVPQSCVPAKFQCNYNLSVSHQPGDPQKRPRPDPSLDLERRDESSANRSMSWGFSHPFRGQTSKSSLNTDAVVSGSPLLSHMPIVQNTRLSPRENPSCFHSPKDPAPGKPPPTWGPCWTLALHNPMMGICIVRPFKLPQGLRGQNWSAPAWHRSKASKAF